MSFLQQAIIPKNKLLMSQVRQKGQKILEKEIEDIFGQLSQIVETVSKVHQQVIGEWY